MQMVCTKKDCQLEALKAQHLGYVIFSAAGFVIFMMGLGFLAVFAALADSTKDNQWSLPLLVSICFAGFTQFAGCTHGYLKLDKARARLMCEVDVTSQ
jgi:hypothetical protein